MIGDDVRLEIALGHIGRSTTVLVRSGISGAVDPATLPERHRPQLAVDTVAELLDRL